MSLRTTLDFRGVLLSVEADAQRWIDVWERAFPQYICGEPDDRRCFRLRIETNETPHVAHDLPMTWRGPQPDGFEGEIFEEGERLVQSVEGVLFMDINHAAGTAHVQIKPDGSKWLHGSAMMQLVDAAMGYSGRFLIHAGALVDPKTGRALLLSVRSGGGKTTTSLALARHGFALMTDDATVLGEENGRPTVWGLPRPLKVHSKTAEMLPWVGPLPDKWDVNGEQGVQLDALSDRIALATPDGAPLGAIIEIGARSKGAHVLSPSPKPQALVALAHENVAGRALGVTPRAQRRFVALARAVGSADTFELSAGTDLESLPALVSETLEAMGR